MPSYVEKVADTMKLLLWDNILEELVSVTLPTLPLVGPFFAVPIVNKITLYLVQEFIAEPLFLIMSRFGVFTSIDWREDAIYKAYEVQAERLVPLQDKDVWDEKDRKEWRDAARELIVYNLKSV